MRVDKTKWEKKILSSCCDVINGDRGKNYPAKSKLSIEGDYPFISAINLQGYTVSSTDLLYLSTEQYNALSNGKIQKGDIALCIRGSLGKFGFFPFENGAIASSLVILRSKDNLYQKFLGYYLRSCCFGNQILENNNGVAQPNLAANKLSRFLIRVPEYNIQVNIASELDSLQEVIDGYKEQLGDLDALAQSIFLDTFGDPITNSKGWEETLLTKVIREITSSKRIFANEYTKEGIPFYRIKEIIEKSHQSPLSIELFISVDKYNEIKSQFGIPQINDLLITAVGSIGNIWLVDNNNPFYFKDGNVIWVKTSTLANSIFLKWMLYAKIDHLKRKISNGSAYSALTIIKLKGLSLPFPPLSLQQQFATQVEAIEQQKELIRLQLADAETLMAERMQYYFS